MTHTLSPELARRVVRYAELRPQKNSYLDKRTPGSDQEETFSVIGQGTIENKADRHIHIEIPHGFDMGGARMPPGCTNSQHSHDTAEVFLVHRGTFTMLFGPNREDGELVTRVGDVISIPVKVFRGFRNSGTDLGHLVSILGGGRVTWAPYVFEEARDHGLFLLASGRLIDTVEGDVIPEGAKLEPPTTEADLVRFRRLRADEMEGWFVRGDALRGHPGAPMARPGVEECPVIGCANPAEDMPAAPIPAPHGFQVRRLRMQPGAAIPAHVRHEVEVLFVHGGTAEITAGGGTVVLGKGDYFSVPAGTQRAWRNTGEGANDVQVIHGGDHPAAPTWLA